MSSQPVETPAVEAAAAAVPEVAPEAAAPVEAAAPDATPAAAPAAAETPAPAEAAAAEPAAPAEPKVDPIQALYASAKEHGHPEIWGVTLANPATHVPSQIVFQKFLNANDGNLTKAHEQLLKTLAWRAETKPLDLIKQEYSREKFEGLGYVTTYYSDSKEAYNADQPETKQVFTWNVYGNTKSLTTTFGDTADFIKWRVALMEIALEDLSLATATKPITADYDPYKLTQIHDYKSVSFLRQTPLVKVSSKATIELFAANYPELLKEKYFVNVPAIMGFFYAFVKVFVAAKTIQKFHPLSNGKNLAKEMGSKPVAGLGEKLPAEYGGKADKLAVVGTGPILAAAVEVPEEAAPVAEAPAAEAEAAPAADAAAAPAESAAKAATVESAPAPEAAVAEAKA